MLPISGSMFPLLVYRNTSSCCHVGSPACKLVGFTNLSSFSVGRGTADAVIYLKVETVLVLVIYFI